MHFLKLCSLTHSRETIRWTKWERWETVCVHWSAWQIVCLAVCAVCTAVQCAWQCALVDFVAVQWFAWQTQLTLICIFGFLYLSVFHDKYQSYKYAGKSASVQLSAWQTVCSVHCAVCSGLVGRLPNANRFCFAPSLKRVKDTFVSLFISSSCRAPLLFAGRQIWNGKYICTECCAVLQLQDPESF